MVVRSATHAGSWYSASKSELSPQLDRWLDQVPAETQCIGADSSKEDAVALPAQGARAIIAPHAGYAYSGPAAAWAYKALDLSNAKRVFLLGPSHHAYLTNCVLSRCDAYSTPLGDLRIDKDTVAELAKHSQFQHMSRSIDEAEHSLEMHLPYIYKVLSRQFGDPSAFPPLVPIMVGSTDGDMEQAVGQILAPHLADPTSVFVVSSDFCHWGTRFRYTYYRPTGAAPRNSPPSGPPPTSPPIHQSIANVDMECMVAVENGDHDEYWSVLEETGNTVCGRHPIGVILAAVQKLREEGTLDKTKGHFKFVRYERSSLVETIRDSSVSYCSAFAIL
ncbi:MEMO1 family [Lineolata rhizophorae]|uniref:MEMO1 family n=1 Tax=Lineolata rhizophorae TaxID=578093 RepID=A0A6A6NYJ8_9PEZI|nr:MEMO1 family [Lineolata rhizophorae]